MSPRVLPAVLMAGCLLLAGCGLADPPGAAGADPRAAADPNVLVVGSAPTLRPLEYVDENNEITGLIVDLINATAQQAGMSVRYESMSFDSLIPALQAERIDLVTSMGDLPQRRRTVTFVDYLRSGAALLVPAGNPRNLRGDADLCGIRLAFSRGSSQQEMTRQADEACAAAGRPRIQQSAFEGSAEALLTLRSGQADAAWGDGVGAVFAMAQDPGRYDIAFEKPGYGYGIGFPKADVALRERFTTALQALRANGTYDRLVAKWGLQRLAIKDFTVNRGKGLDVPDPIDVPDPAPTP